MKTIDLKLGNMRKAQNFIVDDINGENKFMIQSEKSIGVFDKTTGTGKINFKGCYFMHLNSFMGAIPFTLETDVLKNCLECLSIKGDIIGEFGSCVIINQGITLI
jgi:hypothetical protein